jgi:hypothetical protein
MKQAKPVIIVVLLIALVAFVAFLFLGNSGGLPNPLPKVNPQGQNCCVPPGVFDSGNLPQQSPPGGSEPFIEGTQ